jgi:GH15 family glucan-1,4-alpha-glucosidase
MPFSLASRPGRYTFSQAWCWVALDRGAKLARTAGQGTLADLWAAVATTIRGQIMAAANARGFFAQTLDCGEVDASSLLLPSLGVVSADHPLFLATIERCEAVLRRYAVVDDFGKTENTFSMCTLWWIEALANSGKRNKAEDLLEHFLKFQNSNGLYSEDIDPSNG